MEDTWDIQQYIVDPAGVKKNFLRFQFFFFHLKGFPNSERTFHLFGIYDGHYGTAASDFCKKKFFEEFFEQFEKFPTDLAACMKIAFENTEKNFIAEASLKETEAGTTALVIVIQPELKKVGEKKNFHLESKFSKAVVGSIGDCEAVLYKSGNLGHYGSLWVVLNEVHSAKNFKELERVKVRDY